MADGTMLLTPEIERETAPAWDKVKDQVSPLEWRTYAPLIAEINRLKRERDAVILAHNYMTPEIFHGAGDYVGDSLGLAMVRGMHDNMPAAERSKLLTYMDRLSRISASEPEVRAGSLLLVEHTPGKGTTLWLNGVQKGDVVPDPEYFSSVARI